MINITEELLSQRFDYTKKNETGDLLLDELVDKCAEKYHKKKHSVCPLCACTEVYLVSKKDRLDINVNILICKKCNFIFNDSLFSDDDLAEIYGNYIAKIWWNDSDLERTFTKKTSKDSYANTRYNFIKKHLNDFNNIKNVVEIGASMGTNLVPFYNSGKKVVGFDFDEKYMKVGEKFGLEMKLGGDKAFFESNLQPDLVILSHVVEHINDIDNFFKNLYSHIDKESYIYIEVPGVLNSVRERSKGYKEDGYISNNNFLGYLQFLHNYHFAAWHLIQFCERNGFEVLVYDEVVRLIIKKGDNKSNIDFDIDMLEYLKNVENDYQSLRDKSVRFLKRVLGK